MKQTAVEWLAEQMLWNEFHTPYLEQAKEMEKQQIIDAYKTFLDTTLPNEVYEEHYNETFNK
jgi:hypothetical protein